jgi:hypothetical protein
LLAQSCWLRERDEAIKGGEGEHASSMINRGMRKTQPARQGMNILRTIL